MREDLISAAIEKSLSFLGVPMQIQHHLYLLSLSSINDLIFDEIDLWVVFLCWIFPPSIEVTANQRTPIVTMDHSIRVHHWKYLEDKAVS